MKHVRSIIGGSALLIALSLIAILAGCGGGGDKGSCTTGNGCGDDFTEGQCSLLNGYFEEGGSC